MKQISLRTRLALLLVGATLIALGIAAWFVDWRVDREMQQRFDASLLARAQALAVMVRGGAGDIESDTAADRMARFPGVALDDWYAVTCGDRLIAQSTPAPPPAAAGVQPRFINAHLDDGRRLREVVLRFQPMAAANPPTPHDDTAAQACTLRYALDREPLDEILRTLDWILLGSIFGACALVLLLTPWLVRRGLQPLALLDRAMTRIGPENPGERLPSSRTTELVPLVKRFNDVLARMDAGMARERQFAAGLAHEFRTRLAELRTLIEVESRYPSGRETKAVLAEIGSIGAELEATVTALLQLTRIQSSLEPMTSETVLLAAALERLRARHEAVAAARAIPIQIDCACAASCAIETVPALLDIVLDNLLGNALAYAPAGSPVVVRAQADAVIVRNIAPALQAQDLAHFGTRFWRKQAQGGGHVGLGLALANAAAGAMRMTLSFELTDGELRARLAWQ